MQRTSQSSPSKTPSIDNTEGATTARLLQFRDRFDFYAPRVLKIRTKQGTIAPLFLNRAQRYLHRKAEEQLKRFGWVRLIGLKGRQQGFSTYVQGRCFWRISFRIATYAYILTHEDKATKNLFQMAERFYNHCPTAMKPHKGTSQGFALRFDKLDSGYDVGTAGTKGTGRSGTFQLFHGSEVGYWPNAGDHMAGVGQAVPLMPGTEIFLESTAPDEAGSHFEGMWDEAMRGESEYLPVFVPWYWQEEYRLRVAEGFRFDAEEADLASLYGLTAEQLAWRRWKIKNDFNGEVALFQREYPNSPQEAFAAGATGAYIDVALVSRAQKTRTIAPGGPKVLGVDVAEYGTDRTVLCRRHGRRVLPLTVMPAKTGIMASAGAVARMIDEWKPDAVFVDQTGVGAGVVDRLHELNYDFVVGVHNGSRPDEPTLYVRKRDEQWGGLKKWLTDPPCQLPDDDVLAKELSSPKFKYDSSRRLVIEPKEKMQERGLKSPDRADALALTFAYPVVPREVEREAGNRGSATVRRHRANWKTA